MLYKSLNPVADLINLSHPKFEFDAAHLKYGVWTRLLKHVNLVKTLADFGPPSLSMFMLTRPGLFKRWIVLLKRANVPLSDIVNFYCTVIRPVLEYCAPVFHHALPQYLSDDIERVQKRALSIICPYASYSECLVRFDLVTLHARCVALCSKLFESITIWWILTSINIATYKWLFSLNVNGITSGPFLFRFSI